MTFIAFITAQTPASNNNSNNNNRSNNQQCMSKFNNSSNNKWGKTTGKKQRNLVVKNQNEIKEQISLKQLRSWLDGYPVKWIESIESKT